MKIKVPEEVIELNWYADRVVWGYYEEGTPIYYQGREGEHEINEPVTAKTVNYLVQQVVKYRDAVSKLNEEYPELATRFFSEI